MPLATCLMAKAMVRIKVDMETNDTIHPRVHSFLPLPLGGEFCTCVSGWWYRLKPFFLLDWLKKIRIAVTSGEWADAKRPPNQLSRELVGQESRLTLS
jgi:hypothetical protein